MRYFIEIITTEGEQLFYGANSHTNMMTLVNKFRPFFPISIVVTELGEEILRTGKTA